jgi:Right handed beta helix region
MSSLKVVSALCLSLVLLMSTQTVRAATLYVNCDGKIGLTSIGAALKALRRSDDGGQNTINVTGGCHENILIKDMDRLTIAGINGASITDVSGDTADVVDIRSSNVTITGMTIDGLNGVNYDAVDCEQGSHCRLTGNTLQGGADAVGVYTISTALIIGGVIQNATSSGILAWGDVIAGGVTIQGNPRGINVQNGGRVRVRFADPAGDPVKALTQATIANNNLGISLTNGAELTCVGCLVQNNTGDGIHLDVSTAATISPGFPSGGSTIQTAIKHNSGYGVYIGDLSSATFKGPASTVTGNGLTSIWCNSPTAVTRNAITAAGGAANTNCTN